MKTRLRKSVTAVLVAGLGAWALAACRGESPQQLLETAKFEELQFNEEHARTLYERIIADHPSSPEAETARQRLAELDAPEP